jgi:NADH-quinone oxidoreductase chain G
MMVRITIDGQTVMVDGHMTVLEAARKLGIYIPTFCDHPKLSHLGACRMCLVEVEGMGKFQTACTLAVAEGMVVSTESPTIEKARKNILEFLLINHPLECTVCDASGECLLQDYTFKYGSAETRFEGTKRVLRDHIISPLIDRNLNRCIQCKRCVRICDEVQGVTALGMSNRGAKIVVGPFMEKSLDCEFCGHCVWSCPVGAITSRVMRHKVRIWEMEKSEAICPYCSVGCTLVYNLRDNKVLKVSHVEKRGINDGSLCSRGYFGYDVINHSDRLTSPLIRKGGNLVPASWDEALREVARGLKEASDASGGDSVGGIASDRLTNEDLYLFQKLFRTVLGSNNVDTPSGAWAGKVLPVLEERLGVFAATNAIDELQYAQAVLLVGCDVTVTSPISGLKIKAAIHRRAKVIEIMPRRTALSRLAHRTLLTSVGSEVAVIKGMMKVIFDEDLADETALKGFNRLKELKKSLVATDLAKIAKDTGVPPEDISGAAREFITARRASVLFGEEAVLQDGGEDLVNAMIDLMILTGHVGQEGCGIYPIQSATNFQGAVDMGVSPSHLPGHVRMDDSKAGKSLEKLWKKELPKSPGVPATQMLASAKEGKINALYLAGVNPMVTFPDGKVVEDALSRVDFLVVQEMFLTETAKLAHVVLPASGLAEKNGSLTSLDRRVQRTNKAIESVGRSLADWRIFSDLGAILGSQEMKYINSAEVLEEISNAVPYYSGINFQILADNGLQWPFTREDARDVYHQGYLGTRHLLSDGLPEDKRSFAAVGRWEPAAGDTRYPHTLILGELLFHAGTCTRHSESLNMLVDSASLKLNPATAEEAGIEDGGQIRVVSAYGDVVVPVLLTDEILPGVLFMPRHFPLTPVSRITGIKENEPQTAVLKVRLEKVQGGS